MISKIKCLLALAFLTCLYYNQINSGLVYSSFEKVKGELVCNLDKKLSNVSHVQVFIYSNFLADYPATLFGTVNNFTKFPVKFQIKYKEEDLVKNELNYDRIYAVFKNANNIFEGISFECQINGIDQELLSSISNNLEKVKIKFLKS
jgi:hypothetical protein